VTAFLRRAQLLLAGVALVACKTGGASTSGLAARSNPQPVAGITPQLIARGDTVFHSSSCTDCHGRRAKGTAHGPDLTSGRFVQIDGSYEGIVKIITIGVPVDSIVNPSFPEPMPPRGGGSPPLSDEQIRSLASYVYSLSHSRN
jgi:mono/diheme cytochrome c family protein